MHRIWDPMAHSTCKMPKAFHLCSSFMQNSMTEILWESFSFLNERNFNISTLSCVLLFLSNPDRNAQKSLCCVWKQGSFSRFSYWTGALLLQGIIETKGRGNWIGKRNVPWVLQRLIQRQDFKIMSAFKDIFLQYVTVLHLVFYLLHVC